jgi:hypothetical protein
MQWNRPILTSQEPILRELQRQRREKNYNATSSLVRLENKNIFFFFLKTLLLSTTLAVWHSGHRVRLKDIRSLVRIPTLRFLDTYLNIGNHGHFSYSVCVCIEVK